MVIDVKIRSVARRQFTKIANQIDELLVQDREHEEEIVVNSGRLEEAVKELQLLDGKIKNSIISVEDFDESTLEKEIEEAAKYQTSHTPETSTSMSTSENRGTTYLQTVLVEIQNKGRSAQVRTLYDSGSQHTYLKEEIAKKLQLKPIGTQTLSHCLFGGVTTNSTNHKVYNVTVRSLDKSFQFNLEALSQKHICNNIPKVNLSNNIKLSNVLNKNNVTLTDILLNTMCSWPPID
ncbi:hypothetical protein ACJJTC_018679 [Scirpophaga incertulas]